MRLPRRLVQLRTLAFYFLIPAISAATPLLVYPAVTTRFGAGGFASIVIAQSIGGAGGVVAELGWSVLGPQRIARGTAEQRRDLYQSALATKGLAVLIVAPLAAASTALVVQDHHFASALLAFGSTSIALSPSWFLIGSNRPLTILWTEGVPRTLLLAASAGGIALGGPLVLYGAATLASVVLTVLLVSKSMDQPLFPSRTAFKAGRAVIREHLPVTFGRVVSVVYTSLPIAIVGLVNPSAVASFGAVERLTRMSLSVLSGVPSRLQSWVGVAGGVERTRRSRRSILINLALGVLSAVGFALLAPFVASIVFAGRIDISFELSAIASCIILAVCTSRGYGLSLVAEGRASWIAAANIGAAIVGLVTIFTLAGSFGARGALVGEIAAEAAGLLVQCFILHNWRRHLGRRPR